MSGKSLLIHNIEQSTLEAARKNLRAKGISIPQWVKFCLSEAARDNEQKNIDKDKNT
jgi:hypothetical protein